MEFHLPERPAWTCRLCGDPYPCRPRRAELLTDFAGAAVQFAVFMAADFAQAVNDLPEVPVGDLSDRFFWFQK